MKKGAAFFLGLALFCAAAQADEPSDCANRVAVVFSGYSSSENFSADLHQEGRTIHHIHTMGYAPQKVASHFRSELFASDYATADYSLMLAHMRSLGPNTIAIAGSELGAVHALRANRDLGLTVGPTDEALQALSNKYDMIEFLAKRRIAVAKQTLVTSAADALAWIDTQGFFPGSVVLKPNKSSASDNVIFCESREAVIEAFNKIYGGKDLFGRPNEAVLVQEKLQGTEYVLNVTIENGEIIIKVIATDLWRYQKKNLANGTRLYEIDYLLKPDDAVVAELVRYGKSVIEAYGVELGWGHLEIMMTANGPKLVEVGMRMMGSHLPLFVTQALGRGQIEAGKLAYFNPTAFRQLPDLYAAGQAAAVVTINTYESGRFFDASIIEKLKTLKGIYSYEFVNAKGEAAQDGDSVAQSVDLLTATGTILILHPDEAVVREVAELLVDWANQNQFSRPTPEPTPPWDRILRK